MEGFFVASVFIGIPWVLGAIYRSRLAHERFMKVLQIKTDMNARLLDRLGAEPNVLEFLRSDVQQQLFDVRLNEPVTPTAPMPAQYARMVIAIQLGIVAVSGGLAFLYIRQYISPREQEELLVLGTLGVAVGMGAILSSAAGVVMARVYRTLGESRA